VTVNSRSQIYLIVCIIIIILSLSLLSAFEPLYVDVVEEDSIVMLYQLESIAIEALAYGSTKYVMNNVALNQAFLQYVRNALYVLNHTGIFKGKVDKISIACSLVIGRSYNVTYIKLYRITYSFSSLNGTYIVHLDVLNVDRSSIYPVVKIRYYHYSSLTPSMIRVRSLEVIGGIILRNNDTVFTITALSKNIIMKDDLGIVTFLRID